MNTYSRLGLACALMAFSGRSLHAQSYQDLYEFSCPTGCAPTDYGRLLQGSDGNLYGTTTLGGTNNLGTIFRVNTLGTVYTAVWEFDGTNSGSYPDGGLISASYDSNFYGTTTAGGSTGGGTLFRLDPSTSTVTVVHSFTISEGAPVVPPTEAKDYNLYGTTDTGSTYRYDVKHGTYQLLPNKAPAMSYSPLLSASDGNLYGVSEKGGKYHQGTIYRMSLAGAIHVVHSFNGADGDAPQSALIQAKDGTFFGTTGGGGSSIWGTVFSFTLAPATLNTLWSFNGTDGALPIGGLVMGLDGSLYGTTLRGGINGVGNIFEISSPESSPVFADLFDFADSGEVGVTGDRPYTGLKLDTNGTIYGLTGEGGAGGDGVFFSLSVPNPTFNITLCCNWWLILDQPVLVLGQGLTGAVAVNFGGVPAQFSVGSDTYLTAAVPNTAIDGPITVTLATGLQLQSQQNAHILPDVAGLDPPSGPSGTLVSIVGGGFAGTSSVTFDGMPAADFMVISPALIQAVVPAGAASGKVEVVTPNGKFKSPKSFIVN